MKLADPLPSINADISALRLHPDLTDKLYNFLLLDAIDSRGIFPKMYSIGTLACATEKRLGKFLSACEICDVKDALMRMDLSLDNEMW